MTMGKLGVIAFRDLVRNRRRSLFTLLAVALGLALLIVLNGFIAGVWDEAIVNSIRLQTGHVQLRNEAYEEEKLSLRWPDLVNNAAELAGQASAMPEVKAAAPVLWANGILSTLDDAAGLRIFGIDSSSSLYTPIQDALNAGRFLDSGDRNGILLGSRLAESMGVTVGQRVSLALINAEGQPDEGLFTVRGLFSTGVVAYDENAVFMLLDRAQAFADAGGRASAVVLLLNRQEDAETVAAALQEPRLRTVTWRDLNATMMQAVESALSLYIIIDGIVMLIVAVIIANTLLMSVFERIREMGVLAALGMKGRQILSMILLEALILGLAGIVLGVVLGLAGVGYLAKVGIGLGDLGSTVENVALGSTMHAAFVPGTFAALAIWTLVIILLASLYPAWYAARLEPVEALHAL